MTMRQPCDVCRYPVTMYYEIRVSNDKRLHPICLSCKGSIETTPSPIIKLNPNLPTEKTQASHSELEAMLENSRRVAGDNADLAMRYRNVLETLLNRSREDSGNTILSQQDVIEIETALETR